jgi:hypothetical protein
MAMMNRRELYTGVAVASTALLLCQPAAAEVRHDDTNPVSRITYVSDDSWQPAGFVNGTSVPATWVLSPGIIIDGSDDEAAWSLANEVEVPLSYGTTTRAWIKAVYTDEEVFIRVRWADPTEDREHHPWTWDAEKESYVAGPQVEDSVFLSFEAGCEWTPSLLGGYIYDFDAWQWMAARSDPLGQAVDLYGNVQDRDMRNVDFNAYDSRVVEDDWILKFTENHDVDLHAGWDQIDRVYMMLPVTTQLWVRAVPDGGRKRPDFVRELPAPTSPPEESSRTYPQFSPVKLTGGAGEVAARGQWQDGYWTVEFRRARYTPAEHIFDTIFNRLVQFSVHVFDRAERLDEASESGRLFLQFVPPQQAMANE